MTNPLGVKGCGEAAAVGMFPAINNAVADALGDRRHLRWAGNERTGLAGDSLRPQRPEHSPSARPSSRPWISISPMTNCNAIPAHPAGRGRRDWSGKAQGRARPRDRRGWPGSPCCCIWRRRGSARSASSMMMMVDLSNLQRQIAHTTIAHRRGEGSVGGGRGVRDQSGGDAGPHNLRLTRGQRARHHRAIRYCL